ncbi:MAG: hypothetical protein Q8Q09_16455 [Deltaproteobacteria bacterium]|nr:hypothetical protein [Deltaproteobacteria bacterium]
MIVRRNLRRKARSVCLGLALGTLPALAFGQAQPMNFYGQTLPPDGTFAESTVIVARNANTRYQVFRLDGAAPVSIATGTLGALGFVRVPIPVTNIPIKVQTSDVAYVYLGYDCCNFGGQWHMPAIDGTTFIGREFAVFRPVAISAANQLNIIAHAAATVTIANAAGMTVATNTLTATGVWVDPPMVAAGQVYRLTATGDVSLAMGTANGFNSVHATDSPLASCNTDVGRSFSFPVNRGGYVGARALFNYGAAPAMVTVLRRGTMTPEMLTIPANQYVFSQPIVDGVYDVTSNQPLSVWGGTLEGGNTIDAFGDDISQTVGEYGRRFFMRSLQFPTVVFASENNTTITGTSTVGMTATPFSFVLQRDQFRALPANSDLRFTASLPVSVMSRGGLAGRNDLGTWLRPTPQLDSDGDTILDVDEGGGCGSASPDTDRDGTPDFLDLDSDGDGVPDATEAGDRDLSTAPIDTDGDGIPDFRDTDDDGDGILTRDELGAGGAAAPRDTDRDGRPDYLDNDDDGDGVLTLTELGAGGFAMPRNSNATVPAGTGTANTIPDWLDPDDDGDGVPTLTELGPGGGAMPRNTNATVPAGQGTANTLPDYLDRDDDGDGIPTAVEVALEAMGGPVDSDMIPAYLDLDSDGDGFADAVEAGATPITPANTDGTDRPDFLDLDSDNDCVPDVRETSAGRTDARIPQMIANNNCPAMAPLCNTLVGLCVPATDTDMDGIPDLIEYGPGGMAMPRDSDGDGIPDYLDPDDDGDGVPTRDELGPGGYLMPRNSDAMVPAGEGTSDTIPDYLDPDDDGDGIPTRTERTLAGANLDPDMDGIPVHLDRDSDGDTVPDFVEAGPMPTAPVDTDRDGARDFLDLDSDNDCIPDRDPREAGAARINAAVPSVNADDNCMAPTAMCDVSRGVCIAIVDTDMDGIPDSVEFGPGGMAMPRDSDMDGIPDFMDPDDDGDGVPTRDELGPGGYRMPRNSDAMVPAGEGTSDTIPDYLDPDDDGDGIPTLTERMIAGMNLDPDMDGLPVYLDRDSDGDTVPDSVEAGPVPTTPVDTDADTARDFLDLDSDNDCVPDRDPREAGAARIDPTMPSMSADSNCMEPTPVCDITMGLCVARGGADAGTDGAVGPDGGDLDGGVMVDGGPLFDAAIRQDAFGADSGQPRMDGATGADSGFAGVLSGDGACACRVAAAPNAAGSSSRGAVSVAGLAAMALVLGARRKRAAR